MANKKNSPVPAESKQPVPVEAEQIDTRQRPIAELPTDRFSAEPLLEAAEKLIWALLDDQISAAECSQLERLILDHEQVRRRYLECTQLHIDLRSVYGQGAKDPLDPPKSPVLGSLGTNFPMISPSLETGPPLE